MMCLSYEDVMKLGNGRFYFQRKDAKVQKRDE